MTEPILTFTSKAEISLATSQEKTFVIAIESLHLTHKRRLAYVRTC